MDDLKRKIKRLTYRLESFAAVGVTPPDGMEAELAKAKRELEELELRESEAVELESAADGMGQGTALDRERATAESLRVKWRRSRRRASDTTAPAIDVSGLRKRLGTVPESDES